VESAYELPYDANSFDIAYLRGVLHHMDQPQLAIREAVRVASTVVVIEPNGYNPVLKVLERYSPYHVEHHEKSYPPLQLDRWATAAGGTVTVRKWAGLVPMFCPDWMARPLKVIEPLVEVAPLLNLISCAVYVSVIEHKS
jgi:SAM-dependent methyltransferase